MQKKNNKKYFLVLVFAPILLLSFGIAHYAFADPSATPTAQPTQLNITVNALDLYGNVQHMYIEFENPSGSLIASGFTPVSFSATSGQQYIVYATNYQTTIFNHWDDGATNPYRSITPTQNLTLTAYYTTSTSSTTPTAPESPTGLTATTI